MRMVVQFWTAKDSRNDARPAIRELKGYNLWAYATMNPGGIPREDLAADARNGRGDGKGSGRDAGGQSALLRNALRDVHAGMAAMIKQMPAGQTPFGAGFRPRSPFLEMNQELSELSTAPVSATAFQVPEGYDGRPRSPTSCAASWRRRKAAAKQ